MKCVRMELSDCKVALMNLKVVWKFAGARSGGQCVMICGVLQMPRWYAGNWNFPLQVCKNIEFLSVTIIV